jgi:hypothetical protein
MYDSLEFKEKYFLILFKGKYMRHQRQTLLELKGFILLKVFSSNVQSAFLFDISYTSLKMKITKCFPLTYL